MIKVRVPIEIALLLGTTTKLEKTSMSNLLRIWCLYTILEEGLLNKLKEHMRNKIKDSMERLAFSLMLKTQFEPVQEKMYQSAEKILTEFYNSKFFKQTIQNIESSNSDMIELEIPEGYLYLVVTGGDIDHSISSIFRSGIEKQLRQEGKGDDLNKMREINLQRSREKLKKHLGDDIVNEIENKIKEFTFYLRTKQN